MISLCLAVLHHPEWRFRTQAELDRVVRGRMPGFEDIPDSPTARAIIKEVLRWRPVTPGGVPHLLTLDNIYDGCIFA